MTQTLLEFENVSLSYPKGNSYEKVLSDVNFNVQPGENVVIVGESGSGKSTILKSILGLLTESARFDSGYIKFKDTRVKSQDYLSKVSSWRGQEISMISQDAKLALDPGQTILKQFYELADYHKWASHKETYDRASQLLKKVRIEDTDRILNSYPSQLSGGLCQRVCIAMALFFEPSLILADEPNSALDSFSSQAVVESLKSLDQQALLMVTHDISLAEELADRIIVFKDGKIVEELSGKDMTTKSTNAFTKSLIEANQTIQQKKHQINIAKRPLVEIKDLTVSYQENLVLDKLNLKLYDGEIMGILGQSGEGKSTLVQSIMGLTPHAKGQIIYQDQDILSLSNKNRRQLASQIQMVFQQARDCLNPRLTVFDLAQEVLLYNRIGSAEDRSARTEEVLNAVGLDASLWGKKPPQLSTGQCQRVAIARAIASRPRLLICDEPLSALDSNIRVDIANLLLKLQKSYQFSVLMIAHDLELLTYTCDRICILHDKKIRGVITNDDNFKQNFQQQLAKIG